MRFLAFCLISLHEPIFKAFSFSASIDTLRCAKVLESYHATPYQISTITTMPICSDIRFQRRKFLSFHAAQLFHICFAATFHIGSLNYRAFLIILTCRRRHEIYIYYFYWMPFRRHWMLVIYSGMPRLPPPRLYLHIIYRYSWLPTTLPRPLSFDISSYWRYFYLIRTPRHNDTPEKCYTFHENMICP